MNFLVIGTFSLAKSAFIIGVVVVILAYSFIKPMSKGTLIKLGVLFIILLIPMFVITKSKHAPHVQGQALTENSDGPSDLWAMGSVAFLFRNV